MAHPALTRAFLQAAATPPCTVSQSGAPTNPLISEHSIVRAPPTRERSSGLKSCLKCQKWSPYKAKGAFSTPVCARRQTNGPPAALTGAFLQAAATAAMHCQPERCTHPRPPVPPFLLAQNLSSKRIAPTDNMWPKTDDAKRCHRLLKG